MVKNLQIYLLSFLTFILHSCINSSTNSSYTSVISGHINHLDDSVVILEEWKINEVVKVGEVKLNNGDFLLQSDLISGAMYLLKIGGFTLPIIADSDSIIITASSPEFKDVIIKGSEASQDLLFFTKRIDSLNSEIAINRHIVDSLTKINFSDSVIKRFNFRHDHYGMEISNTIKAFADSTKYFQAALYSLRKLDPSQDVDFFERFINNLPTRFPNDESAAAFGELMKVNIDRIQKTGVAVGQPAPDFTARDMENRPVNLSEFKGNYVLLTFWASWCPPCRHENKNLINVYDSFKHTSLKMIHVSIDKDYDKLKRAIEKDKISWITLNEPNEWDANVVTLYGFHKIPSNYLLDPDGKIIAKNLFGNELMKYLQNIYKKDITTQSLQ